MLCGYLLVAHDCNGWMLHADGLKKHQEQQKGIELVSL
jgi:hypothetical protein